jgi:heme-degrading monooxygenase HmoA
MLAAIYQWRVKPGRESEFVQAWSRLTTIIYERQGSLGSRLHRTEDGHFLAYAQWPNLDAYHASDRVPSLPEEEHCRAILRDCAERLRPDIFMTLVQDQLAAFPAGAGKHTGQSTTE